MTQEERAEMLLLMKEAMQPVLDKLNTVENNQTKIELTIENETNRAIKTIAEGHLDLKRMLDKDLSLEKRVEDLEDKVSALEYRVKEA